MKFLELTTKTEYPTKIIVNSDFIIEAYPKKDYTKLRVYPDDMYDVQETWEDITIKMSKM